MLSGEVSLGCQQAGPGSLASHTLGISVQGISLGGVGEVSIWEFSGHENYFMLYDHFIGNSNCIHVVMFSLAESLSVQITQVQRSIWKDNITSLTLKTSLTRTKDPINLPRDL